MRITIEEIDEINTQINYKKPAQIIITPVGLKGEKGEKGDKGDTGTFDQQSDLNGGYF
jgi:hypothetical protein